MTKEINMQKPQQKNTNNMKTKIIYSANHNSPIEEFFNENSVEEYHDMI